VSGYSGDAGDALAATVHPARVVNGMQFSTPDQDNDHNPGQCTFGYKGWWLNNCDRSVLNVNIGACWNTDNDLYITDVEFARMMVKLE